MELPLCKCGCGNHVTKKSNKYIKGHNSRVYQWCRGKTKETSKRVANIANQKKGKPTWIKGLTKEEHPGIMRISNKLKNRIVWNKGLTEETDERVKNLEDKVRSMNIIVWNKGLTKYTSEKILYASIKQSKKMKEYWKDSEWVKKWASGMSRKPTIPEKFLLNFLQKILPDEYSYTGDFTYWIGRKNPDFINKDENKIIEYFSWHHTQECTGVPIEQHEEERISYFLEYGYQTIIIWDYELKELKKLKEKIISFTKGEI